VWLIVLCVHPAPVLAYVPLAVGNGAAAQAPDDFPLIDLTRRFKVFGRSVIAMSYVGRRDALAIERPAFEKE
jgi:hypothetical protein